MCGILGLYDPLHRPHDPQAVLRATRSLQHRGPDDEGFFFSDTRSGRTSQPPPARLPGVGSGLWLPTPGNPGSLAQRPPADVQPGRPNLDCL